MKIVIINVAQIVQLLIPHVKAIQNEFNYKLNQEQVIDFCLFKSFNNVFCLSINHGYSDQVSTLVYSRVRSWLDSYIRMSINSNEFNIFKGCDLKAITNGEALFITESSTYEHEFF
jgi:hypothetical protein